MNTTLPLLRALGASGLALLSAAALAVTAPVAEYGFNNSFASSVAGAPALSATDPLGLGSFGTDTVFGSSRTVYNFAGNAVPTNQQGGLSLDTTGLLTSNSVYTVELQFKFTQRVGGWRRIFDVENRQSDNGFYVDPGNNLDIYPVAGGSAFTNDVYHDVFLADNNGAVMFYLDGSSQALVTAPFMAVSATNVVNFFLDNVVAGGQGEYSDGSIAAIRLYNAALDADQIPTTPVIPTVPTIPEPQTYLLMFCGIAAVAAATRRRKPVRL